MRILLSTDTVGGVWDHTVTLAGQLDAMGCEVLVAVIGEPRDERLAALPAGVQTTWRTYRLEWMDGAAEDVAAAGEWLAGLARLWNAEVAHLNQMAYAAAGFPCPVVTAVHSDVLSWFGETLGQRPRAEWGRYEEWVRAGLGASAAVVAPTRYQAMLTRRHYGADRVRVIHNGIVPPPARDAGRGTADGGALITVGRAWDRAKGVHVLDGALEILGDAAPPAHLFGETVAPHGERFSPVCLRSHGRVERAEVDGWMHRAGIYVAPSLYEPFGLAPLEAALHGCALVLSDIGSFAELWAGCAAFFPAGDAGALAGVLRELSGDPARRAQLAQAARTRALRRYSAERMAGEYAALYREVAGEHVGARVRPAAMAEVG
jgi:glycosyltransferase involved in cell wall biosynthesis